MKPDSCTFLIMQKGPSAAALSGPSLAQTDCLYTLPSILPPLARSPELVLKEEDEWRDEVRVTRLFDQVITRGLEKSSICNNPPRLGRDAAKHASG